MAEPNSSTEVDPTGPHPDVERAANLARTQVVEVAQHLADHLPASAMDDVDRAHVTAALVHLERAGRVLRAVYDAHRPDGFDDCCGRDVPGALR